MLNCWILQNFAKFYKEKAKIWQKNEITELCKGVHCVDLGESFQTHILLQNLASIQPRTSPVKFARSLAMQPRSSQRAWRTPRGLGVHGRRADGSHAGAVPRGGKDLEGGEWKNKLDDEYLIRLREIPGDIRNFWQKFYKSPWVLLFSENIREIPTNYNQNWL